MKSAKKKWGDLILREDVLSLLDNTINLECVIYPLVTVALYLIYVVLVYEFY